MSYIFADSLTRSQHAIFKLPERQESDDKYENKGQFKMIFLNVIGNIIANGAFAHIEQMVHFLLCFH